MVGAWRNDGVGNNSRAAYLFDTATGEQLATLVAPDATVMDEFGRSVVYHNGWP
jgi:hypothetical protein